MNTEENTDVSEGATQDKVGTDLQSVPVTVLLQEAARRLGKYEDMANLSDIVSVVERHA